MYRNPIFILVLGISLIFGFSFFQSENKTPSTDQIFKSFRGGFDKLINETNEFKKSIGTADSVELLERYVSVRRHFKEIEFLLAELDREYYLKYLNGAPLPKLEKKVPDLRIVSPQGLQMMDELVATKGADNELLLHTASFEKNLIRYREFLQTVELQYEVLVRAIKFQLIRIYTMGVTGFDTPGTLLGISDSKYALNGFVKHVLKPLQLEGSLNSQFERAILHLGREGDFEKFDRAVFYKNHWQPLYASVVGHFRVDKDQVVPALHMIPEGVNLKSQQLFSESIFNIEAYLDFHIDELNERTVALGKELFFDPSLSTNSKMSCASCHDPSLAFSDGKSKSTAITGDETVDRNAPGLINSIYTTAFFFDLRAPELKQQFEHVIFSEKEFNTSIMAILKKLTADDTYIEKFKDAFPQHVKKPVNVYTFKTALSAFIASLTDMNSEFDQYMRGEIDIDSSVVRGYNLFMGKAACATCHFPPLFNGLVPPYFDESESEVLGVPIDTAFSAIDPDMGRFSRKRPKEMAEFYKHSFKTTTVRNADRTAPYMHNGIFTTLEEVINFYNNGGGAGRGLEVPHQTLAVDKLGLESNEIDDVIAFIRSLNSK